MRLERIIMHWTAGTHRPNRVDLAAYHFVIDGDGKVHEGDLPPEANLTTHGEYAAHTLNCNTGSIGVACAAMWDAVERPFDWGKAPLTEAQVEAMCAHVARLCDMYHIPVTPKTVLTHAEVQGTLGIKQRWKWDFLVLPGMTAPSTAQKVGHHLRGRIERHLEAIQAPPAPPAEEIPPAPWAALLQSIMRIFR